MVGIRLDGVSFSYPGRRAPLEAVADVTVSIHPGQLVAFLGPSGCGKSTLLSVIAGLRIPSAGTVVIGDEPVRGPRRDIGLLFQKSTLLPWRSVHENVALGLEVRGVRADERGRIAGDLIRKYGLEEFERKYPHTLSGGMQKRVAFMQALAYNPAILLLDEPFASLDAQTRLVIEEEFVDIVREMRKTVVLVTHDIAEALAVADRIVVFTRRPATVKADHVVDLPRTGLRLVDVPSVPGYADRLRTLWEELDIAG